MSKNKQIINSWRDDLAQYCPPAPASPCPCEREGDRPLPPQFYQYFRDDPASYRPELYSFSPGLEVRGSEVTGRGTVSRANTWVWPAFSGWTSWDSVAGAGPPLHSLQGQFSRGVLCGPARLVFCNDLVFLLQLQCGHLDGLCVATYQNHLVWAGRYSQGRLEDLSCSLDWESGALLWCERTFLYPDIMTALTGQWSGARLVEARQAEVQTVRLTEDNLLDITCSPARGPVFSFSPSGPDNFGSSDPALRDPYETRYIRVRQSAIEDSGEGVFAVEDLPPASLAAVFNGYKIPLCSGLDLTAGLSSPEDIYARLAYNIHMPEDENFFIDFPPEQARLSVYSASLGHKVNHSFSPNCVFGTMNHPRWGRVRTIVTRDLVRAGEELLVDYGYDLLRCPDWYRDMWTDTVGASTGTKYWEVSSKS